MHIVHFSSTLLSVTKMLEHSSTFQYLLSWGKGEITFKNVREALNLAISQIKIIDPRL